MPWIFNPFTGELDYTAAAVTPGGSDTQVQFNDGGAFGGSSTFTWNKTTNTLSVTGIMSVIAPSAGVTPLITRSAVSQTADVFQAQTSGSSAYVSITPNALRFNFAADTAPATGAGLFDGNGPLILSVGGTRYCAFGRYDGGSGRTGIILSAGSQLMFSTGTSLSGGNFNTGDVGLLRTSAGILKVTDSTNGGGFGSLQLGAYSAATIGLLIKGFVAQSANLLELQNSSSTVLTAFDSAGRLSFAGSFGGIVYDGVGGVALGRKDTALPVGFIGYTAHYCISTGNNGRIGFATNACGGEIRQVETGFYRNAAGIIEVMTAPGTWASLRVGAYAASTVALIVRGTTSQSGDLLQLQEVGTSVLARFNSSGYLGIGTSPANPLHVSASSGTIFKIESAADSIYSQVFSSDGNEDLTIQCDTDVDENYFISSNPVRFKCDDVSVYAGGSTSFYASVGGSIFEHVDDVGNVGTGEDDLYSDTLVASLLDSNGQRIIAQYSGTFASSATATRSLKAYFGGTRIYDSTALTLASATDWDIKVTIIRVDSSTVKTIVTANTNPASAAPSTIYNRITGLTLTNTQVLKITGEAAGVGAATNDIVAKFATGEWMPAT